MTHRRNVSLTRIATLLRPPWPWRWFRRGSFISLICKYGNGWGARGSVAGQGGWLGGGVEWRAVCGGG